MMEWRAGKSKMKKKKSLIDPMYSKSAFVTEIWLKIETPTCEGPGTMCAIMGHWVFHVFSARGIGRGKKRNLVVRRKGSTVKQRGWMKAGLRR
jgi:hypothetical protein